MVAKSPRWCRLTNLGQYTISLDFYTQRTDLSHVTTYQTWLHRWQGRKGWGVDARRDEPAGRPAERRRGERRDRQTVVGEERPAREASRAPKRRGDSGGAAMATARLLVFVGLLLAAKWSDLRGKVKWCVFLSKGLSAHWDSSKWLHGGGKRILYE